MTDKELVRLRAISDAAYLLYRTAAPSVPASTPADLEAAWQRLLALRWQSMDSAPRDGTWVLLLWDGRAIVGAFDTRWLEMPADEQSPGWFTTKEDIHPDEQPTAWMPLPPVKD